MTTLSKVKTAKTVRPVQIHLARLKDALATIGVSVPAAKLQQCAAAFYGYRNTNALSAALRTGEIAAPTARRGLGHESLAVMIDPIADKPFGVVVPQDEAAFSGALVTSPYGNLVTVPPIEVGRREWPGESMRMTQLRMGRAALQAYAGASLDWTQPEEAIQNLIVDLVRYRADMDAEGTSDETKDPEEVIEDAFRCYLRENIGEVAHACEPNIRVEIESLTWHLAWTRDKAPCIAALEAYAPGSFDSECDYIIGDLISDLLHVAVTVDHGSPIDVIRNALRSMSDATEERAPLVTVQITVG